ncbi:MAG: hypothetical protein JKY23_00515 [Nitrospinaceae bacterium]|nr:hypothetical protein [Nitrospinaceae bacterium]
MSSECAKSGVVCAVVNTNTILFPLTMPPKKVPQSGKKTKNLPRPVRPRKRRKLIESGTAHKIRAKSVKHQARRVADLAEGRKGRSRPFVCAACKVKTTALVLSRRCAAFHTALAPDTYGIRYSLIYARVLERLDEGHGVLCGKCEGYPDANVFKAELEVNDNVWLRKNLLKWFGAAVIKDMPPMSEGGTLVRKPKGQRSSSSSKSAVAPVRQEPPTRTGPVAPSLPH